MAEAIIDFFATLPKEVYVFIISMLPIVELRGAIPVGAAIGLPFYTNYILAVIGNVLPVPFILFFISGLLDYMSKFKTFRPIVKWIREKADKHSSKVIKDGQPVDASETTEAQPTDASPTSGKVKYNQRAMTPAIFAALLLFVAIPLPGTGAWTGSLISALFCLPKKWALLAIGSGVIISGVIMCLASYSVVGFLSFLV